RSCLCWQVYRLPRRCTLFPYTTLFRSGRVHRVPVAGELGEPVDVLPHPLVRGVEEVCAVLVDLDAGLCVGLRVGVAAHVRPTVDDGHLDAVLGDRAFGDGEAEQSGADDEEIRSRHEGSFRSVRTVRRGPDHSNRTGGTPGWTDTAREEMCPPSSEAPAGPAALHEAAVADPAHPARHEAVGASLHQVAQES